jgi:hypothetical protein
MGSGYDRPLSSLAQVDDEMGGKDRRHSGIMIQDSTWVTNLQLVDSQAIYLDRPEPAAGCQ